MNALSGAKLAAGHIDEALDLIDQVLKSSEETGDKAGHAMCLHQHAAALLRCGDLESAYEMAEASRRDEWATEDAFPA